MSDEKAEKELRALCKLFIGGIPRAITDEQLAEAFMPFTSDESLNDCVVIKDEMKNSRGFGFVTYNSLSDTDNCLANRPHQLGGKEVEVKHAIPREEQNPANNARTNKIFVGGLSMDVTSEEEVKQAVEDYTLGYNGESLNVTVEKVNIIKDDNGQPRGFCFLEMASDDDADKVVIVKFFTIKGKRVELKKAQPKGQKDGMGRGRGRGRDSSRGGGRMASQFGGGWSGGAQTSQYSTSAYDLYGGGYSTGFGGGYDPSWAGYGQSPMSYGPMRASNGRTGGRGGRGGGYRPY